MAGVSPVVQDIGAARRFYGETLGIRLEGGDEDYAFTERLDGVKHLGLWRLTDAARSCFGTPTWPAGVPVPQATVELEVDDVAAAAEELQRAGYRLVHPVRTEPWGQVIARLLAPEGLLVAVCRTPWLRPSADSSPRVAFWDGVDLAASVLGAPELAPRWDDASALHDMTVGDLAAHLVRAVTTVARYLGGSEPAGEPISPAEYFRSMLDAPAGDAGPAGDAVGDAGSAASGDSPRDQAVRRRAHQEAEGGHGEVLRRWEEAVAEVRGLLSEAPPDRLVAVADDLVLTIDDYLATRVVELVVHADDLAVSLGLDVAPPPTAALLAERVLLDVARARHSDTAVLRALARRERVTASVFPVL